MSDEQEKKPTTKFGSMRQQREAINDEWKTIGKRKEETTMPQDTLTQKRHDIKTSELNSEEMKRQTVYIPKRLATRLKIRAAATGEDISGIITRLVETYLDQEEGR